MEIFKQSNSPVVIRPIALASVYATSVVRTEVRATRVRGAFGADAAATLGVKRATDLTGMRHATTGAAGLPAWSRST